MANELTVNLALSFNKGGISTSMQSGTKQYGVAGTDYAHETMSVPTSVTALPLGAIATPGYCMMQNRDTVNYVDVYNASGGAACVRLKPGEVAAFRFAGTAPAVKANVAPVKIEYLLI